MRFHIAAILSLGVTMGVFATPERQSWTALEAQAEGLEPDSGSSGLGRVDVAGVGRGESCDYMVARDAEGHVLDTERPGREAKAECESIVMETSKAAAEPRAGLIPRLFRREDCPAGTNCCVGEKVTVHNSKICTDIGCGECPIHEYECVNGP